MKTNKLVELDEKDLKNKGGCCGGGYYYGYGYRYYW
jgi:hypothetical protein